MIKLNYAIGLIVYFPLVAYFSFINQNEYINIPAILFVVSGLLAIALILHRNYLVVNVKLIAFSVIVSVIYYFESAGLAFFYYLVFLILLSHPFIEPIGLYIIAKKILKILIIIFFINHILYSMSLTVPVEVNLIDRTDFIHGFMQHGYPEVSMTSPQSWRFYGFSNEPGLLAAIILLFLISDKLTIKGNLILWLAGLLTFSSGFFIVSIVYFLYFNKIKISSYTQVAIGILFLYLILPNEIIDFFNVMLSKPLDVEEQDSRMAYYSFVKYYEENIAILILYMTAIVLTPKRFWLFFILVGLYRHHFIFDAAAPLIMVVTHAFNRQSKNKLTNQERNRLKLTNGTQLSESRFT